MSLPAQIPHIGVDDYLQAELKSDLKHEYVDGQVFAMAGAGEAHNRISLNVAFHLRAAARGTRCGVFISDMKLRVERQNAFYYPDVLLTCDREDVETRYKRSACLIVEVLSPSTEMIDRREKLVGYRTLESLRYYLLISQETRRVELYALAGDGKWEHSILEGDGDLSFQCDGLEIRFSLADIYEDVALEPAQPATDEPD